MLLFSDSLQEELRIMLRPTAYCVNPVDLTFEPDLLILRDITSRILASGEADAALIYDIFGR